MIKPSVIGRDADLHLMPTKEQLDAAILTPPQQQALIQEQLGDFAASNLDGPHGQSLQHLIAVNNGGAQCSKFNFGPHPIPSSLNATLNASMDDVQASFIGWRPYRVAAYASLVGHVGGSRKSAHRYSLAHLTENDKGLVKTLQRTRHWTPDEALWVSCGLEAKRVFVAGSRKMGILKSAITKHGR
ncbi:hypothetical protein TeGR_g3952 [Tetraparma gracilis]|uniref:Uncharacterized protein n=1 Tax=Tetraparma gracilis TaxID=2962635 RepID=A0ABQ6N3V3_9STRA|nr:hypothetical protein TeGR_g3952 [Tetraparma gracilis]